MTVAHAPAAPHDARSRAGVDDLRTLVLRGLLTSPRSLPPKLFYDEVGAALFERITTLPEYYLTRAELEILRTRASEIAQLAGPGCVLVEYGSGAGKKVRVLLDALERPAGYVPIDISTKQLSDVAGAIAAAYPEVAVHPVAADYTGPLTLPSVTGAARRLAFFPGSTIGNLTPTEAVVFLGRVRRAVGESGALILGVDRVKCAPVLHAAYNDTQGVTAAFNRNVLARLNRELCTDFQLDEFEHRAFFNEVERRIEMHLVSTVAQTVTVAGARIHFEAGETIWTESSYKYDRPRLEAMARASGFTVARLWTDTGSRFWVACLRPTRAPSPA